MRACVCACVAFVRVDFIIHLMFWLIEVSSRGGWAVSQALASQNLQLDRLANPFSPDAFRLWLEEKRRKRRHQRRNPHANRQISSTSVPSHGAVTVHESLTATRAAEELPSSSTPDKASWDLDMNSFVVEPQPFAAGSSGQVGGCTCMSIHVCAYVCACVCVCVRVCVCVFACGRISIG